MRQAALLVAVVCLLATPAVAGTATSPDSAHAGSPSALAPSALDQDVSRDELHVRIQLQPDGDARWNISARYELDGPNETAAFARLAEEFKAGQTDNGFSVDLFRAVAPKVSERVGRSMEIRAQDPRSARTVETGNSSTGVLTLRFTWTNFSRVENGSLVVDSFTGTWFGDLKAGQTLTIRPPDGYDTENFEPGPSTVVDGGYRWNGPQEFAPGQPTGVFEEYPTGVETLGVSMPVLVGFVLLALLLGGALAWAYHHLRDDDDAAGEVAAETATTMNGGTDAAETTTTTPDSESEAEPAASAGKSSTSASSGTEEELLSDEERVERLLEENGGRMKQAKIVEETRWSNAKVSQLLSGMADEGRVEKLRIGRENLISLPGEGINDE